MAHNRNLSTEEKRLLENAINYFKFKSISELETYAAEHKRGILAILKARYYEVSRELHPDKNPSPNAKEVFQEMSNAYELLHNHYDGTKPVGSYANSTSNSSNTSSSSHQNTDKFTPPHASTRL